MYVIDKKNLIADVFIVIRFGYPFPLMYIHFLKNRVDSYTKRKLIENKRPKSIKSSSHFPERTQGMNLKTCKVNINVVLAKKIYHKT